MICPKFVIINPLKDKTACKSTSIDKKLLFESELFSNEKCQWQKKDEWLFKRVFKDSHDSSYMWHDYFLVCKNKQPIWAPSLCRKQQSWLEFSQGLKCVLPLNDKLYRVLTVFKM